MLTYKFRLYPTKAQLTILDNTIETCRHLYNHALDERQVDWDVNFWNQKQLLTLRKQDNKYYKQVHSQVLQDVLLRLDKAYQAFFKNLGRYPKFKRRERYNSFSYPQYGGWQLKGKYLVLSRIGAIKITRHREIVGVMKRCTIIRDVDQWYCCVTANDEVERSHRQPRQSVGIDFGLQNWLTLSTGEVIQNPLNFAVQEQAIEKLQRSLSRKKKGSHNRHKTRSALAKAWRKIRFQRHDFTHKVSTKLALQYGLVVFEKLNITNMVRNHRLAKAIMDATWSSLRLKTAYKVESRGGQCMVVNPSGTSQKCSSCGKVVQKDLSVRIHECKCGLVLDRDHNAAINILKLGLDQARAEKQPILVRQRISKFASRKQEAHSLSRG